MTAPKPIGYWLKHLHGLLEKQFEVTLADVGVGRRHWQVLNTLSLGKTDRDELTAALAPFWAEGELGLDHILEDLAARGWTSAAARPTGLSLALSDEGRAAHAEIEARVRETRATVLTGLTPEQYSETVRVLSAMAHNVEADLAAR
ncbi:MarR family winged helix-turn-helix transcriptional regulator [Streptomyces sp. NPDC001530]|uniref:MarR family winged helix-turn-helix transcriptional regulator n=1 Tax=Streptomyces sp. NPDC001530 TaxID=3364582 RepID=UPI0036C89DB5